MPYYPTIQLERCTNADRSYDVSRSDEVTRGFVWAARVRFDNDSIDVCRGGLTLGELSAIRTRGVWRILSARCARIQL